MVESDDPGRAMVRDAFRRAAPGRLVGRGHPVGDFLEAYDWVVEASRPGLLQLRVRLPEQVMNPRRQLFGGFTGTYIDFIALHTFWAGREPDPGNPWLATSGMQIEYFEPVLGPEIHIDSRVLNQRRSTTWVATELLGPEGQKLVYALTTLREVRQRVDPEPAAEPQEE